ncbi:hypothetical protein AUC70_04985 [Methyloceanibacter stevinii]|uniref:Uncharacterized protein n=1 Tax=Methyloceanibacter stevinii TaxID=1774970 RepID=A0A1E3VQ46_9HYPH|nr:hypothetical protein [Methyloceanibacter stevinii]ODR95086.1 hypothetical protein AUC70_04985 [Methyloceanibacter stevinii]
MTKHEQFLGIFAAMLLTLLSVSAVFAGDWAGTYVTEDTKGNAFTITLAADSKAHGEKQGHVLEGAWSVDGASAVIKWTTGWTTKLTQDGDGYSKTAYRPGTPVTDEGAKATPVKRVE